MGTKLDALIRLSRFKEYLSFVIVTTLLGAISATSFLSWRLVGVLCANLLAVAFAFMINDVEDAPDDALNPVKVIRNPVSAKSLSPRFACVASFTVAFLSILVYFPLGYYPLFVGICSLIVSLLYSWRRIRLKTIPVLDIISHCLMLAGFQFLAAYFTFDPGPTGRWVFPFLFLIAISMYGVLFNQLRDYEWDFQAGLTHTAIWLGPRLANRLMIASFGVGVVSALITIFIIRLISTWVLLLLMILAAILIWSPLVKARQKKSMIDLQQSFQKPLEIAAASALLIQFVGTWAMNNLNSQLNLLWK